MAGELSDTTTLPPGTTLPPEQPVGLTLCSFDVSLSDIDITVVSYPELGQGGTPDSFENTTGVVTVNYVTVTKDFEGEAEYTIEDYNSGEELANGVCSANNGQVDINVTDLTLASDPVAEDGSMDVTVTLQQIINGVPCAQGITRDIVNSVSPTGTGAQDTADDAAAAAAASAAAATALQEEIDAKAEWAREQADLAAAATAANLAERERRYQIAQDNAARLSADAAAAAAADAAERQRLQQEADDASAAAATALQEEIDAKAEWATAQAALAAIAAAENLAERERRYQIAQDNAARLAADAAAADAADAAERQRLQQEADDASAAAEEALQEEIDAKAEWAIARDAETAARRAAHEEMILERGRQRQAYLESNRRLAQQALQEEIDTPGGTITPDNSFAAQSTREIKLLVDGLTPGSEYREMFLDYGSGINPRDPVLVRNPSFWGKDIIGITGISPLAHWPLPDPRVRKLITHGVAITPRHVLISAHPDHPSTAGNPLTEIYFVTREGEVVKRTILGAKDAPSTDWNISVLDEDLPDTIEVLKILPEDLSAAAPTSELARGDIRQPQLTHDPNNWVVVPPQSGPGSWWWLPKDSLVWGTDQEEKGLIFKVGGISIATESSQYAGSLRLQSNLEGLVDQEWNERLVTNDSSSPFLFLVNNEAIVAGIANAGGTFPGGPMTGGINGTSILNKLINDVDEKVLGSRTGYTVTNADFTEEEIDQGSVTTTTTTTSTTTTTPPLRQEWTLTVTNNTGEDIMPGGEDAPEGFARGRVAAGRSFEMTKDENYFNFTVLGLPERTQLDDHNFTYNLEIDQDPRENLPLTLKEFTVTGFITRGFKGSLELSIGTASTPTDPCPSGQVRNAATGECECPPGQELLDGECVDKCPSGQVRNAATGECECPPGQEFFNGECVDKCPTGWRRFPSGICYDPNPVDLNPSDESGGGEETIGFPHISTDDPDDDSGTNLDYTIYRDPTPGPTTTTTTTTTPYPGYTTTTTTSTTTSTTTPIYTTPPPPCTVTTLPPDTGGPRDPRVTTTLPVRLPPGTPPPITTPPITPPVFIYPAPILPLEPTFIMIEVMTTTTITPTTPAPVITVTPSTTTICPEDPDCNILQY